MYHTDSFWSKNTHGNLLSEKVCGNRELDILKCPISTFCSLFLKHSRDWHDKILATFPLLCVHECVCVCMWTVQKKCVERHLVICRNLLNANNPVGGTTVRYGLSLESSNKAEVQPVLDLLCWQVAAKLVTTDQPTSNSSVSGTKTEVACHKHKVLDVHGNEISYGKWRTTR